MKTFSAILTDLRAAIAVVAARDRTLTVLLVAVWGRVSRVAQRMERLFALWQAGTLPAPRKVGARKGSTVTERVRFPSGRGWLVVWVRDAVAHGSQLEHLMAQPEFAEFLAAVPQAGRILRPLCRMLHVDPVPAVIARPVARATVVVADGSLAMPDGVVVAPGFQISGA